MAMFEYYCPECGEIYTKLRSIKDRDNEVLCEKDGTVCTRDISYPSRVWAPTRKQ